MRKVLFLTNIPFMKHHVVDMYVEPIMEKYDVELWDVSRIYNCKDQVSNVINDTVSVSSIEEFDERLNKECASNEIVIVTNVLNDRLGKIRSTIKKHHCPIVCINKESFNSWLFERGAIFYLRYYTVKAMLQAIAITFPVTKFLIHKKSFGRYKYDYLLASNNYYKTQANQFIKIHHIKYDETLNARKSKSSQLNMKRFILFIDSAPSSHTSYIGRTNSLNHDEYLKKINSFFAQVEAKTGLEIVISLHPKSNYQKGDFGKRKMFLGNTAELINGCDFVMGHYSTSFVNVVLEHKPLLVIYYKEMFRSSFRGSLIMGLQFAKLCGASIHNIENEFCVSSISSINERAYDSLINEHFCVPNQKTIHNSELVCQALERIFQHEYE